MTDNRAAELETAVRAFADPIKGQYLRPWMTSSPRPWEARVFIVGKNQSREFPTNLVDSYDHYVDALFNRNGESCAALYERISPKPSRTRVNIGALVTSLGRHGVKDVLQTNVICYSTSMSSELRRARHAEGAEAGRALFRTILSIVKPRVIVAHGVDTVRKLGKVFPDGPRRVPEGPEEFEVAVTQGVSIFAIPTLAPPAYNGWSSWAAPYLDEVARRVADCLKSRE